MTDEQAGKINPPKPDDAAKGGGGSAVASGQPVENPPPTLPLWDRLRARGARFFTSVFSSTHIVAIAAVAQAATAIMLVYYGQTTLKDALARSKLELVREIQRSSDTLTREFSNNVFLKRFIAAGFDKVPAPLRGEYDPEFNRLGGIFISEIQYAYAAFSAFGDNPGWQNTCLARKSFLNNYPIIGRNVNDRIAELADNFRNGYEKCELQSSD